MTDKQEETVQTAFRIPKSWLEHADKLAERLSQPGMQATRTDVIRLALARGFDVLDAEVKKR
jgi:hypothetical protein